MIWKVNRTQLISSISAQLYGLFGTQVPWRIVYSYSLIQRVLFNGPDGIFSLQTVLFTSHCPLLLDPNTVYLAFRYSLLSFSLNWSTVYSPLWFFSKCLYFSFLHGFLSLVCHHFNVHCSSVYCYSSVILDPVFSFSVHWFFVLFNDSNNHWFLLLSHLFYTCSAHVHNCTQFIMAFSLPLQFSTIYLYLYNIRLHL